MISIYNRAISLNTKILKQYIIEGGQQGLFQQLLYSSLMEVQNSSYDQLRKVLVDDDITEEYEKQQLSQVYKEIKEELVRFKPESLAIFQEWVTRIYKFKVKVTDLGLETKNIQFSISSAEIQKIINRVLIEACSMHKQLIEEQLRLVREQAEEYYKIDSEEPEVGYFDHLRDLVTTNEGTKITEAKFSSSCPNQQFYSYCVWIIYNHYCSLSQCNDIVCELAKIFHQTSENLVYRIFKQIDKKKTQNSEDTDQLSRTVDNCHEIRHIVSMVEDEQVIKVNQLNVLTIVNLIPPSLSIISNFNSSNENSESTKESNREQSILYWHICSFQTTINSIIYENKQNMRRYVVYLRNFKKAIKILKDRLGKSGTLCVQNQTTELKKTKKERSRKKFSFNEDSLLSSQIQKNIDLFRCLDDQFIAQNEKTKSDQAELVKNLQQSLAKQKNFMKFPTHLKMPVLNPNDLKRSKDHQFNESLKSFASSKKQSNFSMKNESIFQNSESNFESITRISAVKSEKMNIERYKLQVILKKNEKNKEKASKNTLGHNFPEQFLEKRRKIDSQLSEHLHKQIVSELKNSFNNYMKNPLSKEEQLANYLKITEKHGKKKIIGFQDQSDNYEPNLHEFIQNGDFRNDQESQADQNYLEKIQEEANEGEKKKKKKKNKKKKAKKNEKPEKNDQNLDQASNTNDSVVVQAPIVKVKPNLKNQVGPKQYEIIKILQTIKIDIENRYKCFEIHEQCLKNMQKRQTDLLDRQLSRSEIISPKLGMKGKKQKVK